MKPKWSDFIFTEDSLKALESTIRDLEKYGMAEDCQKAMWYLNRIHDILRRYKLSMEKKLSS